MKLTKLLALFIFTSLAIKAKTQTLKTETFTWEGNNREYTVYIPASYDGSSDFPLLFNFHGGGDYVATWMDAVDMRPIADTANFILVYPQAFPDPTDGGSTNWMRKHPTDFDDVPFVETMIDSLSTAYNINLERIYACGYSLGGEFTYELSCQLNNHIAAVSIVARTKNTETFNNCSPLHDTGVLTILGTDDFISNYNGITFGGIQYYLSADETHDYWVNHNNCNTNPVVTIVPNTNTFDGSNVERYTWANSEGCTYVEHLKVIGGGHDWPGDFGNLDINSSQEIWNFVSGYDLNGLIGCSTSTSTSETHTLQNNFKAYPNPIVDLLTIETKFTSSKDFSIYSILGELMMSGQLTADVNTIDLSLLPPNIYFLRTENHIIKLFKTE